MKLKIAMLAFAGIAFMQPDATAQSQFAKNYPICKKHGKYVKCTHSEAMNNTEELSAGTAANNGQRVEGADVIYANKSSKDKSQLSTAYEMPNNVYVANKPECETEVVYTGGAYAANGAESRIVCVNSHSHKENPRFKVAYDQPRDIYNGEDVLANDGVKNNIKRNINYLDNTVPKAPVDGGLATQ